MSRKLWLFPGVVGVLLTAALLTAGGCASETPLRPSGLEQKIESARTPSDHEEIASLYEQQAGVDKALAERHRGLARVYAGFGGGRGQANPGMRSHCESLARTYQQAAEENLALAKMHRNVGAEMK